MTKPIPAIFPCQRAAPGNAIVTFRGGPLLYGVTAVTAPGIGPTGGWITDNYAWRWIFRINVPVGVLALGLVR